MPDLYTLKLSAADIKTVADHLKDGVYKNVNNLLANIAAQVDSQNHTEQQRELQRMVSEAAVTLESGETNE